MSAIGRFAMLAGSLLLGVGAGWIGFRIFLAKIPDVMQSGALNMEARVYYLGGGLALGVVIWAWTRVTAAIARHSGVKAGQPPAKERP